MTCSLVNFAIQVGPNFFKPLFSCIHEMIQRCKKRMLYQPTHYTLTHIYPDTHLTNVIGLPGNQPPFQADHFNGVQADLKDVVDKSQQGSKGECCHKYGGETELDH